MCRKVFIMEKKIPMVSGIDALYYFAETNHLYEVFFLELLSQVEDRRREFDLMSVSYQENDIIVSLQHEQIVYSGAGRDGFNWFSHEFFRIGFKDRNKNVTMANIRIQLNAIGIYTLGLKSLVEYINDVLLKDITTGKYPITRIDLNVFVQHDFSYLRKEMIVSKKKNHATTLGERTSGYELETYYIGKKPFLLRIYNKRRELTTASEAKKLIMHNYFGINGLSLDEPIFNVEFELHREYLKTFGIDTIEDALSKAVLLFKEGCKLIRLIDPDTIKKEQINTPSRRRAKTLPVWQSIEDNYSLDAFLQVTTPLSKIPKISYRYTLHDARKPIKKTLMRLMLHDANPTQLFLLESLQEAREEFAMRKATKDYIDKHDVSFEEELRYYSNEGLENFEEKLSNEMSGIEPNDPLHSKLAFQYDEVYKQLVIRGLRPELSF